MRARWELVVAMLFVVVVPFLILPTNAQQRAELPARPAYDSASPLLFVENVGQFDPRVRFQVRGSTGALLLSDNALWYTLSKMPAPPEKSQGAAGRAAEANDPQTGERVSLRVSFVGANASPQIEPIARLSTTFSYFIGNTSADWRTDVPVWGGVRYKEIYPGIDLELGSVNGELRQQLVARTGANLGAVRMRVAGADSLALGDGVVRAATPLGTLGLPLFTLAGEGAAPSARASLQTRVEGSEVAAPFATNGADVGRDVSIQAAPALLFSRIFGGNDGVNEELAEDIALDSDGNIYLVGYTYAASFPDTAGLDRTYNGRGDAYVLKLAPDGSIVFGTFLGGTQFERAKSVAVDSQKQITVVGWTRSSETNGFPMQNPFDGSFGGGTCGTAPNTFPCADAFIARFNAAGNQLIYSSFWGHALNDFGFGVAVQDNGFAYATGSLDRGSPGASNSDAFFLKIASNGSIDPAQGGSEGIIVPLGLPDKQATGYDEGGAIVVNSTNEIYIRGSTESADFYTTGSAYKQQLDGGSDVFVTKLSPNNSGGFSFEYSTYIGGSDLDGGRNLALGPLNSVIMTGWTTSADFPKPGQPAPGGPLGRDDAYLLRLNPTGSQVTFATYFGGSYEDEGYATALGPDGSIFVTGYTYSADFSVSGDALDPTCGTDGNCNDDGQTRPDDAFLTRFDAAGNRIYSTFLGGDFFDGGYALAIDGAGTAYVTGFTRSQDFPITAGVGPKGTIATIFLAKIGEPPPPPTETPTNTATVTNTSEVPPTPTDTATATSTATNQVVIPDRRAAYLPAVLVAPPTPTSTNTPSPPPIPPCNDVEPNNTVKQPSPLTTLGGTCVGSLAGDPENGEDYYSFQATQGQTIIMALDGLSAGSDFDLYLYDPADREAASSTQSGQVPEQIQFVARRTGTYKANIFFDRVGPSATGYLLTVRVQ